MSGKVKQCPFCGENIPVDAAVCEYCCEQLPTKLINNAQKQKIFEGCFFSYILGSAFIAMIVLFIFLTINSKSLNDNIMYKHTNITNIESTNKAIQKDISNERGVSGSANFYGINLCSRKKVGKILSRKYAELIENAEHNKKFYDMLSLSLHSNNKNLKFKLKNPKVIVSSSYMTNCTCDIEYININPNTKLYNEFLYNEEVNCKLYYYVREKNGKYLVTIGESECKKIQNNSLEAQGFE